MSSSKPAFVLVHGGWHTPFHYQPFIDALRSRGYKVVAPALPSITEKSPNDGPEADIKCVSEAARSLTDEGYEVVIIGHSCGGLAAAEAPSGLGIKERAAKGLRGGVRTIIFVAAMVLPKGQPVQWGGSPDQEPLAKPEGDLQVLNSKIDYAHMFYSDIPKEKWGSLLEKLTKHPIACPKHIPRTPAYNEVDLAFLFCENDQAFLLPFQQAVVANMKTVGVNFKEASIPSGHFPFLSMPNVLVEKVLELA